MKVHLTRLRVLMAVAVAGGLCQHEANGQYLPYRPTQQTATPYSYPTAPQQGQVMPQAQAVPQTYGAYQPQQQMMPQAQQYAYPPAVQQQYPTVATNPYPQVNRYPTVAQAPQQVTPTPPVNAQPMQSEVLPGPANGMTSQAPQAGVPMTGMPNEVYTQTPDGHMHGNMSMSGPMQGYPQTDAANCAPYPSTGSYASGGPDYGLGGYMNDSCGPANQWFGGVYFLFMERDNASYTRVTIQADPPTDPYYPPAATTVLSTDIVDYEYREGLELRFGSTFSVGAATDACNPSGCGTCGPSQLYAWEVGLWAIDNDIDWFTVTDDDMTDTYRIYGMVNYAGLEYDDGGGMRPVNEYYDHQMPVVDDNPAVGGDYRVYRQRIRTNFRANNVELNFLRFPVCDTSCGTTGCNDACGYGYNACSNGYGAGCQTAACAPSGPDFSMAGMCGLRYFRMDDSFEHSVDAYEYSGAAWVDTAYEWDMFSDYNLDNHLFGFQLGVNMNYCVACKWNFFCDSAFGVYNNHINQYARVYGPTGAAYEIQSGREATINNDKNDIAFLGEMRLGGAYDLSCNWRAVMAYRAVAVSGVALATEQINPEMSNWAESSRIDSGSSIVIHGLQAGVECRY